MARGGWRPDPALGEDPDYRFTLANERTFLAWIRTSLALVAGGLAATQLLPALSVPLAREALGTALVALGVVLVVSSFRRWVRNEEAMRERRTLPSSRLQAVLTWALLVVSTLALTLLLVAELS
jgi:putative membrane protein